MPQYGMRSLTLALLLFCPVPSAADSSGTLPVEAAGKPAKQEQQPVAAKGSRASFDKRLPPVFPGEEVNAGGNKMKVWSTSGPVPVGQAPEPFDRTRVGDLDSSQVGVIIDREVEHRRRAAADDFTAGRHRGRESR